MPPWFADPKYGNFDNDRTLSQAEINTLVSWVDVGAQRRAIRRTLPSRSTSPKAGTSGSRTWCFEMPTAFQVPASGTIDYQYVIIPTNFTEDKYVQFAESRPSDREHTHHILSFLREPRSKWLEDAPIGVAFVPSHDGGGGGGTTSATLWAAMPRVRFRT